jgi:predicted signal transduction protein with EAL and GGDEF domain
MRAVAEGVEKAQQLEVLARHGCETAQGFYFSRPMPADECRDLLTELAGHPSFTDTLRVQTRPQHACVLEQVLEDAGSSCE